MTVYAIGATSLIGGGAGALDAEVVSANGVSPWSGVGETPGIHNGDPAFVTVSGDKIYHYIANEGSGAVADGKNIIIPLWYSEGVPYTGDIRWILHKTHGVDQEYTSAEKTKLSGIETGAEVNNIVDGTNTGDIIRWNAVTEAWESSAEPFHLKQINLTPQAAAMEDIEGGMYYKATDKAVYICTNL